MTTSVVKASEDWLQARLASLYSKLSDAPNNPQILKQIREAQAVIGFQRICDWSFPKYQDWFERKKVQL